MQHEHDTYNSDKREEGLGATNRRCVPCAAFSLSPTACLYGNAVADPYVSARRIAMETQPIHNLVLPCDGVRVQVGGAKRDGDASRRACVQP